MYNFWDNHTVLFILGMCIFPRLTMLFATTFGGGILYWLGWVFAPRLTVAVIATILYREQNPVLVVLSWICAFSGEFYEKETIKNTSRINSSRK